MKMVGVGYRFAVLVAMLLGTAGCSSVLGRSDEFPVTANLDALEYPRLVDTPQPPQGRLVVEEGALVLAQLSEQGAESARLLTSPAPPSIVGTLQGRSGALSLATPPPASAVDALRRRGRAVSQPIAVPASAADALRARGDTVLLSAPNADTIDRSVLRERGNLAARAAPTSDIAAESLRARGDALLTSAPNADTIDRAVLQERGRLASNAAPVPSSEADALRQRGDTLLLAAQGDIAFDRNTLAQRRSELSNAALNAQPVIDRQDLIARGIVARSGSAFAVAPERGALQARAQTLQSIRSAPTGFVDRAAISERGSRAAFAPIAGPADQARLARAFADCCTIHKTGWR